MSILKRCPFCGSRASVRHVRLKYATDYYFAICRNCGIRTRKYKTDKKARAAWNRRQKPSVAPCGWWIDTGSGEECSHCGEIQYGYDSFRYFCAYCGSKNKREDERR